MGVESLNLCWPEWEIIEILGEGQFGSVYKCKKSCEGIEVFSAIKIISIPKDDNEHRSVISEGIDYSFSEEYYKSIVNDFSNEIRLMENLKGYSNIVSIEDFAIIKKENTVGWDVLIRMELLHALPMITNNLTLTEKEVVKIGIDLCNALEICYQQNIIHRDIKPANIFCNDTGVFKLGDFGIARRLEHKNDAMSSKGTPAYLAPEVLIHNRYDSRVDIYSLGIVLYQLLNNNKIPFLPSLNEGEYVTYNDKRNAVDRRISGEPLPQPENASAQLSSVILKACEFNPDMRYNTPVEFKQALINIQNSFESGEKNTMYQNNNNYNNFNSGNNGMYHTQQRPEYPDFISQNKKKSNNVKYAVLFSVIAVLLVVSVLLGFMLLKPEKHTKIITMLENGQYNKAYDSYIDVYGRGKYDDKLIDALKIRINDLKDSFDDGMMDTDEISEEIDVIDSMKIKEINNQLDELRSYVNNNSVDDVTEATTTKAEENTEAPVTTNKNVTDEVLEKEPIEDEYVSNSPEIVSAQTLYGDVLPSSNVNINRSFGAEKTIDGYYDSCWCVSTDQQGGAGGEIRYNLSEKSIVSGVKLVNGNLYMPVEEELYLINGQVKNFTLTFSDGTRKYFTASYNGTASNNFEYFNFDEPVSTEYIILTVDSGYPGEYYSWNVCLGEFDVF